MRTVAVIVAIFFAAASFCQGPLDGEVNFNGDEDDASFTTEIPGTESLVVSNETETTTLETEVTVEEDAGESDFQIVEDATESDFQIVEKNASGVSESKNDTSAVHVEESSDDFVTKNSDKIIDEPAKTQKSETQNSTLPPTTTNATKNPSVCINCTTVSTTTTDNTPSDKASFFSSFNLNYLYLLLLLVPILGIFIAGYWYCRRRRRKLDGYVEPSVQKSKRLSTPSWVFSEPDFHDEEVTTLEEERKL